MNERSVADELLQLLDKNGVGFMTLSAVLKVLRKRLGLPSKATGPQIVKAISPHLSEPLRIKSAGKKTYIAGKPDDDLLLGIIKKREGKGPTTQHIPFTKETYAEVMNRLIEQGKVRVRLNKEFKPMLYAADAMPVTPAEPVGSPATEEAFRDAFRALERGLVFVKIYELRRTLGWPRNDFDAMLRKLRDGGKIGLHVADPAVMTADGIQDSFLDESGIRMGAITWLQGE